MIRGKERLFEAITGEGWVFDEETEAMVFSSTDGRRRLVYKDWGWGATRRLTTFSVRFRVSPNGFAEATNMSYLWTDKGEERVTFSFATRQDNGEKSWPLVVYSWDGKRWGGGGYVVSGKLAGDALSDSLELMYPTKHVLGEIDPVMTANLFVDQFCRGEIRRPIMVPKGWYTYEEGWSGNLPRAKVLVALARTLRDKEIAEAIYLWVQRQEVAKVSEEISSRE